MLNAAGKNWVKAAQRCDGCSKSRILAESQGVIACPACLTAMGAESFEPVRKEAHV